MVSRKPGSNLSYSLNMDSPVEQILQLQGTVGNRAVTRLIRSGVIQAKLFTTQAEDMFEQEAERAAEQAMQMPGSLVIPRIRGEISTPGVQKQETGSEETAEPLVRQSGNHAGEPLTDAEIEIIIEYLEGQGVSVPTTQVPGTIQGARFVLHDTAANVSQARIAQHQREGRGPLGSGIAAWVPRAHPLTISRPDFYETQRPTASEHEKAEDIIAQSARETELRRVWGATKPSERTAAMTRALTGLGLTVPEIASETTRATTQLNASSGKIYTTGIWTIREICNAVNTRGAAVVAQSPLTVPDLTAGCTALRTYFTERQARIGSAVNVELVQSPGSHCRTTGTLTPLSGYTPLQYQGAVALYLRAALMAGLFPEVTTHFWVDRALRGHCDPRCFDLWSLYSMIAGVMRHGSGSTYGDTPNFGTTWGTHNVWWHNTVCGGSPPTAPSPSPSPSP